MTIAEEVVCEACGKLYHLKFQTDDTIELFDWPIVFGCENCGNELTFKLSSKEGFQKFNNGTWEKVCQTDNDSLRNTEGKILGYSPTLPIVSSLYHQTVPVSIGLNSPFMRFCKESNIDGQQITRCNIKSRFIIQNIIPYRNLIPSLCKILQHKPFNGNAFINKCIQDLEIDTSKIGIQYDLNFCIDFFDHLLQTIYKNLVIEGHFSDSQYEFYHKAAVLLAERDIEELNADIMSIQNYFNIEKMLMSIYEQISEVIGILHKLLQGVFRSEMDTLGLIQNNIPMYIMTIGHKELLNIYKEGYEIISKVLVLLAGINNRMADRNFDDFGTGDHKQNLTSFARLTNGKRIELLCTIKPFSNFLNEVLNSHWRNANEHANIEYDAKNQICRFKYDSSRPSATEEVLLIDIAKATYRQLVFLIEISKLLWIALRKISLARN